MLSFGAGVMNKLFQLGVFLSLLLALTGCSSTTNKPSQQQQEPQKTVIEHGSIDASNNNGYQVIVQNFLQANNLKIFVNSGAAVQIELPKDFSSIIDGTQIGALLKQRNELSKQNNLDFSSYLGHTLTMYTAEVDKGDPKSNYSIILLIAKDKLVGNWIDQGASRADFHTFRKLLSKDQKDRV